MRMRILSCFFFLLSTPLMEAKSMSKLGRHAPQEWLNEPTSHNPSHSRSGHRTAEGELTSPRSDNAKRESGLNSQRLARPKRVIQTLPLIESDQQMSDFDLQGAPYLFKSAGNFEIVDPPQFSGDNQRITNYEVALNDGLEPELILEDNYTNFQDLSNFISNDDAKYDEMKIENDRIRNEYIPDETQQDFIRNSNYMSVLDQHPSSKRTVTRFQPEDSRTFKSQRIRRRGQNSKRISDNESFKNKRQSSYQLDTESENVLNIDQKQLTTFLEQNNIPDFVGFESLKVQSEHRNPNSESRDPPNSKLVNDEISNDNLVNDDAMENGKDFSLNYNIYKDSFKYQQGGRNLIDDIKDLEDFSLYIQDDMMKNDQVNNNYLEESKSLERLPLQPHIRNEIMTGGMQELTKLMFENDIPYYDIRPTKSNIEPIKSNIEPIKSNNEPIEYNIGQIKNIRPIKSNHYRNGRSEEINYLRNGRSEEINQYRNGRSEEIDQYRNGRSEEIDQYRNGESEEIDQYRNGESEGINQYRNGGSEVINQYRNGGSEEINQYRNGESEGINQYRNGESEGINQYRNGGSEGINQYRNGGSEEINQYRNGESEGINQYRNGESEGINQYRNGGSEGINQYRNVRNEEILNQQYYTSSQNFEDGKFRGVVESVPLDTTYDFIHTSDISNKHYKPDEIYHRRGFQEIKMSNFAHVNNYEDHNYPDNIPHQKDFNHIRSYYPQYEEEGLDLTNSPEFYLEDTPTTAVTPPLQPHGPLHRMENTINFDSPAKFFPKEGYEIDHYFDGFPAFGYFDDDVFH